MKKIYFILFSLLFPAILFGQGLNGNGTYASPYNGTMEEGGDVTWSSDSIYIDGDVIVDDEKLTINAGVKIKFVANDADLIITGTGQLTADGTSGSKITFTADDDDDGIYGETGERWGHISFQSMGAAGASIIDYCIIEYGDVSGTGLPNRYGGAIHTDFSDLTISNCILRNNKAGWGGGILVNKDENPEISNCIIKDNNATNYGGGIYLWENTSSIVSNCIIEGNYAQNNLGGGGLFLGDHAGGIKIYNCVIVSNSTSSGGDNVTFYYSSSSPKPQLINCIIWDALNPVGYAGQSPASTDFINCAISNYSISSYTNCISINNNDAANGPNFNATDGTDWSIKVISPCRDSGTDTGAPATDFDGNSRVGTTDIGAYEVQYNQWKTTASSTDWGTGTNWVQGVPTSTHNVVIPTGASNYPTGSSSQNYTIGTGYGMVLDPGAQATLGTLTTNGDLRLRSDASNISSLIINDMDATANVELYLTGGEAGTGNYRWHYISSPFYTKPSITPFTAVTYNLAQFHQGLYTSSNQGWIAFDGYIYPDEGMTGAQFTVLSSGRGYNFYDNVDNEITISGQLEYQDVDTILGYGDNGLSYSGFNLLGNPFSSGLDWDKIVDSTYFDYPGSTSTGLYFTRDDVQCSYVGGLGSPGDVNGIIPPMQGFFVKTNSTGNTITLPAAARTHNSIHARYKGKSTIPLIRLSITKDSISDETVVRFAEQADPGLDNYFDALKMFLSNDKISIYSYSGETKYAINGQPFPENSVDIPLAINSPEADSLKITATQIQGLEDYDLTLKDLDQDVSVDLNQVNEYIFAADSGTVTDRFILTITNLASGLPDIFEPEPEKAFNIYSSREILYISPAKNEWNGKRGDLRIYDITGKLVKQQKNIEWHQGVTKEISLNVAQGIYIIEIRSVNERFVGKVGIVR